MKKYTFNPQPIYQGPSTTWNGTAWETKQIISINHSYHDAFVKEEGKVITNLFYSTEYNTLEDAQRDFDRMIEIDKLNDCIKKLKNELKYRRVERPHWQR